MPKLRSLNSRAMTPIVAREFYNRVMRGETRASLRAAGLVFRNDKFAAVSKERRALTKHAARTLTGSSRASRSIIQSWLPFAQNYMYRGEAVYRAADGSIVTIPLQFSDDKLLTAKAVRESFNDMARKLVRQDSDYKDKNGNVIRGASLTLIKVSYTNTLRSRDASGSPTIQKRAERGTKSASVGRHRNRKRTGKTAGRNA